MQEQKITKSSMCATIREVKYKNLTLKSCTKIINNTVVIVIKRNLYIQNRNIMRPFLTSLYKIYSCIQCIQVIS